MTPSTLKPLFRPGKPSRDALIITIEVGGAQRKLLVNPPAHARLSRDDCLVVIARSSPSWIEE